MAAEGASDAIAYGEWALLFAHCEGVVLEHFGKEFPPLAIIGFRGARDRPVETLSFPRARYDADEIEAFRVMRGLACRAVRQQDPRLLGRVATLSACINQRRLCKPEFETVLSISREQGAFGIQVAHSGTLIGLMLDAEVATNADRVAAIGRSLARAGFGDIASFTLGSGARQP